MQHCSASLLRFPLPLPPHAASGDRALATDGLYEPQPRLALHAAALRLRRALPRHQRARQQPPPPRRQRRRSGGLRLRLRRRRRGPVRVPLGGSAAAGRGAVPGGPVPERDAGVGRQRLRVGEDAAARAGRGGAAGAVRARHRDRLRGHVGGAARVGRRAGPAAGGRRAHAGVAPPPHVDHADLRSLHPLLVRVSGSFLLDCLTAIARLDWVWIGRIVSVLIQSELLFG